MDNIITAFEHYPVFFYLLVFTFSLIIGSFLNVVVHRLPIMMEREWRCDCREFLADELTNEAKQKAKAESATYNLSVPRSACPKCNHQIKWYENIPVLSWLMLKGKCSQCNNPISFRYPFVELLTAVSSLAIALHFGVTELALIYILLTWCLISLIFIDIDKMLLPDQITIPLVWLGLITSLLGITIAPSEAIIGAAVGYLSLWSVFWLFKLATGKEGMGYGDFKLMAVFGAFLGWQMVPLIVLLSSFVGAIVGITILTIQKKGASTPIPFGPYIAIAGWLAILYGDEITNTYFNLIL
ncbi:prepilin peptidase [Flocculibacter collagenilyticus]|uniref:prepilin peptidase n=1 Tax=Flocculibacter collagenilyticus TaxID=2744479 RepID=UPI003898E9B0